MTSLFGFLMFNKVTIQAFLSSFNSIKSLLQHKSILLELVSHTLSIMKEIFHTYMHLDINRLNCWLKSLEHWRNSLKLHVHKTEKFYAHNSHKLGANIMQVAATIQHSLLTQIPALLQFLCLIKLDKSISFWHRYNIF